LPGTGFVSFMPPMNDAAYYRSEADRCRNLAAAAPSTNSVDWLQLALQYQFLADTMSGVPPVPIRDERGRSWCAGFSANVRGGRLLSGPRASEA
jgi:hypothetical protein